MHNQILFVDDDKNFMEVTAFLLEEEGYEVMRATNGSEAFDKLKTKSFPVMVTDLKMPGLDGLSLLKKAQGLDPNLLIIVITAFGDTATAVSAMKAGAFDFLPKPCDRDQFKLTIRRAMEHARLKQEIKELRSLTSSEGKDLLFVSKAMTDLMGLVERVAVSDATILIEGESGTGKELIARRIHNLSSRQKGPFVPVNCGSIPRDLLESELFGHTKGAFTGATHDRKGRFLQAEAGTIFLDEIAELPLELQTRLLRVLQEKILEPVGGSQSIVLNIRVIAATNKSLDSLVKEGNFRQDLFYRLNVVLLRVPPLRERPQDIIPLTHHFLSRYSGGKEWCITPSATEQLLRELWPGNVRELENLCQRATLLSDDSILSEEFLASNSLNQNPAWRISPEHIELPAEGFSLVDFERAVLIRALEINNYNQSSTARFLHIPRHILLYRMKKFNIPIGGQP